MTMHLQEAAGRQMASPSVVAADILTAVDQRRAVLYTPKKWQYIMAVVRSMPRTAFTAPTSELSSGAASASARGMAKASSPAALPVRAVPKQAGLGQDPTRSRVLSVLD